MKDTVLVTGGAQRIGAEIVRRLHGRGLDVAVHCRSSRDAAEALARELNEVRSGSARVFAADLRDHDAVLGLADDVQRTVTGAGGRLVGLVNNASSFFPTPFGRATAAHWDDLFATNARAPFFLAQGLAEALRAAGGAVVNVVDIHADRPLKDYPVYTMAKAALGALTRVLAVELGPDVRANGVAPGAIVWPEGGDDFFSQEEQARIVQTTPLGRTGEPAEIADAVLFLLLDARYVTGQILAVDGGRDVFL
jgi:pteridine reductase